MLDQALGWIGSTVEYLGEFLPRPAVRHAYEAVVMWRWGGAPKVIEGDKFIWWPFATDLERVNLQQNLMTISVGPLSTADDITVRADVTVTWVVKDPLKFASEFHEAEDGLDDRVRATVCEYITSVEYDFMVESFSEVSGELEAEIESALSAMGVTSTHAAMTAFSKTRHFSLDQ